MRTHGLEKRPEIRANWMLGTSVQFRARKEGGDGEEKDENLKKAAGGGRAPKRRMRGQGATTSARKSRRSPSWRETLAAGSGLAAGAGAADGLGPASRRGVGRSWWMGKLKTAHEGNMGCLGVERKIFY